METPDWVRDAVFYQIFPDRFARSDRVKKPRSLESWESKPSLLGYKGGDLFGIIEHLDHIQTLGANALYLTPVFQATSNHRYNTHDYYRVDPMVGGNQALHDLLEVCHGAGMKVILDGVFNHCGRGLLQFQDIVENGRLSPYVDWYHIRSFPLNAYNPSQELGYESWWGLPTLPKFNTQTAAVREFLWGVATHWLRLGIDGWRLDVPNEIDDDDFWREFRRRCHGINPDCYLVGEIWGDATRWLQGDQFDAVTNYEFARAVIGFVGAGSLNHEEIARCGYNRIDSLSALEFAAVISRLANKYRPSATQAQLNFVASHDTPRALTIMGHDESAVRLALLFQMTYPGAPCIFYGEEIGLEGGHDPYNRLGMPWQRREEWNMALFHYVKKLIALRHEHAALRRGRFQELYADNGLYAFARELDDRRFIIALNVNRDAARLELPKDTLPGPHGRFRDLLNALTVHGDNQTLCRCLIPGRSGAVLEYTAENQSYD